MVSNSLENRNLFLKIFILTSLMKNGSIMGKGYDAN